MSERGGGEVFRFVVCPCLRLGVDVGVGACSERGGEEGRVGWGVCVEEERCACLSCQIRDMNVHYINKAHVGQWFDIHR